MAWVVDPGKFAHELWAWHHTPGIADHHDAYRSELYGLIGGIYTINQICNTHQITRGYIVLACDGIRVL